MIRLLLYISAENADELPERAREAAKDAAEQYRIGEQLGHLPGSVSAIGEGFEWDFYPANLTYFADVLSFWIRSNPE